MVFVQIHVLVENFASVSIMPQSSLQRLSATTGVINVTSPPTVTNRTKKMIGKSCKGSSLETKWHSQMQISEEGNEENEGKQPRGKASSLWETASDEGKRKETVGIEKYLSVSVKSED